jgi:GT2 family glycosyltransferase
MNAPTVSIVIATYRRPAMLRDTLQSLLSTLKIPADEVVEVLVIDNDPKRSAEDAVAAARPECERAFGLRYIPEPQTGLSRARNRGIEEARGEVIGFLDDDVFISENWLIAMLACLRRPGAAAAGGRIENHWEDEPEPAVRASEGRLVAAEWGHSDFVLRGRRTPGGGNSVFHRWVFADGLRFSTELGRVGEVLLSGEDTELFKLVRRRSGDVWYCAGGLMYHRIGGERLTQEYLRRRSYWFGYSYAIIDRRVDGVFTQWTSAAARLGKLLLVDLGRLAIANVRRSAPHRLIARCSIAKQTGYLRATFFPMVIAAGDAALSTQSPAQTTPRTAPDPAATDRPSQRSEISARSASVGLDR